MRAKFYCESVTNLKSGECKQQEVKLSAVYSNDKNTEDNQFSESTPSGTLTMFITNQSAIDFFEPGEKYYMDFSKAE